MADDVGTTGGGDEWLEVLEFFSNLTINDLPGKFRSLNVQPMDGAEDKFRSNTSEDQQARLFRQDGNMYLIGGNFYRTCILLEYSPNGKFVLPAKLSIEEETHLERTCGPEQRSQIIGHLRNATPPLISKEQLEQLASDMGVERGVAAMLWIAGAHTSNRTKNFLPKPLREAFGLKVNEADQARNFLHSLGEETVNKLASQLVHANPWEDIDGAMTALKAAWQSLSSSQLPLSGDVAQEIDDITASLHRYWNSPGTELSEFLRMVANPSEHHMLTTDPVLEFADSKRAWEFKLEAVDGEPHFCEQHLNATIRTMFVLAYRLPVADPARNALPELYYHVQKRIQMPNLWFHIRTIGFSQDADIPAFMKRMLGPPKKDGEAWISEGPGVRLRNEGSALHLMFQPSAASDIDRFKEIRLLNDAIAEASEYDSTTKSSLLDVAYTLNNYTLQMLKRIAKPELEEGQWEQNALLSTPALVEEVAQAIEVDSAAACYYLQLLALGDPTDKNIKLWNDWKPSDIKRAGQQLVEAGKVVEAKRARAGRKFFLPGGWEPLKLPHLPIETWKLKLFKLRREGASGVYAPLARIIPHASLPSWYAMAWKRVTDGDAPQYDDVK